MARLPDQDIIHAMDDLSFRWLGVAGLEFTVGNQVLLIDPFLTRPSLLKVLTNRRVTPDESLLRRHIPRAGWILVTHAHYDHMMDVPAVLRQTGALAAGGPNTCALLKILGAPSSHIRQIQTGDSFSAGPFKITVLPAWHMPLPIDWMVKGAISPSLKPPLRLADYRMDAVFSFLIEVNRQRILVGNEPQDAIDTLFMAPFCPPERLFTLLTRAQPKQIIPIHWDDYTRPVTSPPRQLPLPSARLEAFQRSVKRALPGAAIRVPALLTPIQ